MITRQLGILRNFGQNSSKWARTIATSIAQRSRISEQLTSVDLDSKTGIATLTLKRPPANALNLALLQQIRQTVDDLERLEKCRGLIVTSASDRIFSAGLDLNFLYQQSEESLIELWTALQEMWLSLYGSALPTVALINGHATAGGCLISICCDYRVMLPNFVIGMNETRAGVAVPKWVMDTYTNVVTSRRVAEADLIDGKLYKSDQALSVGLIDELVATKDEGHQKALEFLKHFKTNPIARGLTKRQFREEAVANFKANRQEDVEIFLKVIQSPEVQGFLGVYLSSLGQKKKKTKTSS